MIRILFHKKGTHLLTQFLKKKFRNFIVVFSFILFYFCVCECEAGVCVRNRPQPELSGFKYLSFTQKFTADKPKWAFQQLWGKLLVIN